MSTVQHARADTESEVRREFERQVENLVRKGYPEVAGITAGEFRRQLGPLGESIRQLAALEVAGEAGRIPFVIVVKRELVAVERALPLVALRGKSAFTDMAADDIERFTPIEGITLPAGAAYLLVDIDLGRDTLNATPDDALPTITAAGRSPLTLEEGIALVTHYPEVLKTHNCFSLLGSRCGDRRVPALWVSRGRPRLGWCWAGNPHTWLGSASCAGRVGGRLPAALDRD
jgi:hypothetical protein